MEVIDEMLDGFELPSFPHVITEALGRLSDPDVSMAELAAVLELDPGMSVKLLRLANSAATGLRNPVESLRQVVTLLGRNQVESLLICTAARSSVPKSKSAIFNPPRFWRAAASRAVIATRISAVVEPTRKSETFTAALLQDMALPVLVDNVDGYEMLLARWYDGAVSDLARAETETFGWDHASVSARMGSHWQFPEPLLEAIGGHHDEGVPDVMLGVRLVSSWCEIDEEANRTAFLGRATKMPQLEDVDCEALLDDAMERVGDVAALFS